MKKILCIILGLLFVQIASADTVNIDWLVDGQTYSQTTCTTGDDLILPTTPTKYGYTFRGWAAYTFLEYIESTGSQYIDTGIVPTFSTGGHLVAALTKNTGKDNNILLGAGAVNSYSGDTFAVDTSFTQNVYRFVSGRSKNTISFSPVINQVYNFNFNYFNNQKISIDGNQENIVSSGSMPNVSIHLFNFHSSGSPSLSQYATKGARIYEIKLTEGNDIIFNGIPARRDIDGAIGLFDSVTGTFFDNIGSGMFVAGPEL